MDPDGAGSTMELPAPELHEKLLQEIALSPKQRQAALAYRNHLLSRMGATLRQRRDISLQLLRTLGAQQPSSGKQVGLAASAWQQQRCAALPCGYLLEGLELTCSPTTMAPRGSRLYSSRASNSG